MRDEVAGQGRAQGQTGEKEDQHRAEAGADVLRKVAHGSANPCEIKTRRAAQDCKRHIDASVPAVKNWKAVANLRDELERSGDHDDGGGSDVGGDGGIPRGVASNVPATDEFMPREVAAPQRGEAVEGRDRKGENELADDG